MKNRDKIEKKLFEYIRGFHPDDEYIGFLKGRISKMSDARFKQFILNKELKVISSPLNKKPMLSYRRCLHFLVKNGVSPFKRVVIEDELTGIVYSPKRKILILPTPVSRVVQTTMHKRSIPTNLSHIDQRTNQPTGPSKGSRISNVEAQIISSQGDGYPNSLREFFKYRGGDAKAFNAMNKLIMAQGTVSHGTLNSIGSRPKAAEVLRLYLTGQHYKNNA